MPTVSRTFQCTTVSDNALTLDIGRIASIHVVKTNDPNGVFRISYWLDGPTSRSVCLRANTASSLRNWLDAHSATMQRTDDEEDSSWMRRSVAYQTNPDADGPHNSKLAFLTTDAHEWRFDAETLNWVALTPIKGSKNFTVSYLVLTRPQREHTIASSTARDIATWIEYTKLFTKSGDDHAPQWTRTIHTSGKRRVVTDEAKDNAEKEFARFAAMGDQGFNAMIDVKIEQVMTMAMDIGKNPDFIHDIAPALRLIIKAVAGDMLAAHNRIVASEALKRFTNTELGHPYDLPTTTVKGGKKYDLGLRPTGTLEADALACLQDVVSHASDFREALAIKRLDAQKKDREDGEIDAPLTTVPGNDESYWIHQQVVHERMVRQAQAALDLHAKVSK